MYEPCLQLIQSHLTHWFGARILTLPNHFCVGTQRHKRFNFMAEFCIFLLNQHKEQWEYNHCGYLAQMEAAAAHPRCISTQHSCSVCGTACTHRNPFPQEQAELCIPTSVLLPKGLVLFGWVLSYNMHQHMATSRWNYFMLVLLACVLSFLPPNHLSKCWRRLKTSKMLLTRPDKWENHLWKQNNSH